MKSLKIRGLVKGKNEEYYNLVTVISLKDEELDEQIIQREESVKANWVAIKNAKEINKSEKKLLSAIMKNERIRLRVRGNIKKVSSRRREELNEHYPEEEINSFLDGDLSGEKEYIDEILNYLNNVQGVKFHGNFVRKGRSRRGHRVEEGAFERLNGRNDITQRERLRRDNLVWRVGEEVKLGKAKREEVKLGKAKREEVKLGKAKREEVKLGKAKREEVKLGKAKREEVKLGKAKREEVKAEKAIKEKGKIETHQRNGKVGLPPLLRIKNKAIQKKKGKKKIMRASQNVVTDRISNKEIAEKTLRKMLYEIKMSLKELNKLNKLRAVIQSPQKKEKCKTKQKERQNVIYNLKQEKWVNPPRNQFPMKKGPNYEENKLYFKALFQHIRGRKKGAVAMVSPSKGKIISTEKLASIRASEVVKEENLLCTVGEEETIEITCEEEFEKKKFILKEKIKDEYRRKRNESTLYDNRKDVFLPPNGKSPSNAGRNSKYMFDDTALSESDRDDLEYLFSVKGKNKRRYGCLPGQEAQPSKEQLPKEQPSKEQLPKEQPPKEQPPKEQPPKEQPPKEQPSKEQLPKEQLPMRQPQGKEATVKPILAPPLESFSLADKPIGDSAPGTNSSPLKNGGKERVQMEEKLNHRKEEKNKPCIKEKSGIKTDIGGIVMDPTTDNPPDRGMRSDANNAEERDDSDIGKNAEKNLPQLNRKKKLAEIMKTNSMILKQHHGKKESLVDKGEDNLGRKKIMDDVPKGVKATVIGSDRIGDGGTDKEDLTTVKDEKKTKSAILEKKSIEVSPPVEVKTEHGTSKESTSPRDALKGKKIFLPLKALTPEGINNSPHGLVNQKEGAKNVGEYSSPPVETSGMSEQRGELATAVERDTNDSGEKHKVERVALKGDLPLVKGIKAFSKEADAPKEKNTEKGENQEEGNWHCDVSSPNKFPKGLRKEGSIKTGVNKQDGNEASMDSPSGGEAKEKERNDIKEEPKKNLSQEKNKIDAEIEKCHSASSNSEGKDGGGNKMVANAKVPLKLNMAMKKALLGKMLAKRVPKGTSSVGEAKKGEDNTQGEAKKGEDNTQGEAKKEEDNIQGEAKKGEDNTQGEAKKGEDNTQGEAKKGENNTQGEAKKEEDNIQGEAKKEEDNIQGEVSEKNKPMEKVIPKSISKSKVVSSKVIPPKGRPLKGNAILKAKVGMVRDADGGSKEYSEKLSLRGCVSLKGKEEVENVAVEKVAVENVAEENAEKEVKVPAEVSAPTVKCVRDVKCTKTDEGVPKGESNINERGFIEKAVRKNIERILERVDSSIVHVKDEKKGNQSRLAKIVMRGPKGLNVKKGKTVKGMEDNVGREVGHDGSDDGEDGGNDIPPTEGRKRYSVTLNKFSKKIEVKKKSSVDVVELLSALEEKSGQNCSVLSESPCTGDVEKLTTDHEPPKKTPMVKPLLKKDALVKLISKRPLENKKAIQLEGKDIDSVREDEGGEAQPQKEEDDPQEEGKDKQNDEQKKENQVDENGKGQHGEEMHGQEKGEDPPFSKTNIVKSPRLSQKMKKAPSGQVKEGPNKNNFMAKLQIVKNKSTLKQFPLKRVAMFKESGNSEEKNIPRENSNTEEGNSQREEQNSEVKALEDTSSEDTTIKQVELPTKNEKNDNEEKDNSDDSNGPVSATKKCPVKKVPPKSMIKIFPKIHPKVVAPPFKGVNDSKHVIKEKPPFLNKLKAKALPPSSMMGENTEKGLSEEEKPIP
ncbi:conserved Plasmodium protein, unknown function [Plasmodium knowlesi strain H]|uniref:Uncharacterized protein n=2 Tax=Plasmodium knowlesi (strain H) TaxID=5851 RepID=A0A1A7VUN4_PLAKH|nr:conserved Plasmodium protein, unknown function [Plasmodium knowlesi strain H]CAA9987161.1 conserved Plasmodium protein, unknown function [Plasmodium knowlesi strain H]SBO23917.1 conserved Plasmodium protein, unknown function [Plasmodium knowlesi strain H]SBO25809.1 conserved Plasmodium protein, unknown function [Plasmodium knowlesi strain H]VVS76635.1 conserved Plasmodium protein, unknown function [Plasmodium knowlesi strain H]